MRARARAPTRRYGGASRRVVARARARIRVRGRGAGHQGAGAGRRRPRGPRAGWAGGRAERVYRGVRGPGPGRGPRVATGAGDHQCLGRRRRARTPHRRQRLSHPGHAPARDAAPVAPLWACHALHRRRAGYRDGRGADSLMDSWWRDIDDATLNVLAAAGGRLTLAELASRLGMSEDAVRSVVTMLAERGRVRIAEVELARPRALAGAAPRGAARRGAGQSAVIGKTRRSTP